MASNPMATVMWTEDEIDFGPDVVLDPARPIVIWDDTFSDEMLADVLNGYADLNDGGAA